jgi:hypothetical protein
MIEMLSAYHINQCHQRSASFFKYTQSGRRNYILIRLQRKPLLLRLLAVFQ